MIPIRIAATNFLSYGEVDVDLRGLAMVGLVGDNGAGKSALAVDALTWALWGESRARSDDDLVRAGADECQVAIDVQAERGCYRITRRRRLAGSGRAGTSALTLELLNLAGGAATKLTAETIKETQERIDAILGLDGKTFINTACLVQGRADEFARAGPKDRKDLLTEILGVRSWQVWAMRAHEARRDATASAEAEAAASAAMRQVLAGSSDLKTRLADFESKAKVEAETVGYRERAVADAQGLAQAQAATLTTRDQLKADLGHLETQERQSRSNVDTLTRQMQAIDVPPAGVSPRTCPTCGQEIADRAAAGRLEEWAARQRALRAELAERLAKAQAAMDLAVVEAGAVRERLTAIEVEIEGVGDMGRVLKQAEDALEGARRSLAYYQTEAATVRGRLEQLRELEGDLEATEERQARAAARAEDLGAVEAALGPNGIQAMLIDAAIPEIVDEANRLLDILTAGTTTIDLRTQRAGKTTGRDIETLDLLISDALGIRPYELYSGGERFRVDFATRIALSRLLARRASAPCRTLVIDEGFGSQDGHGREALMECLSMIRAEFGLVLVISHVDDLREALPNTILVEKGPNGSRASLH
jgi:DNA repair exonuclease SbcCD ATPase subunit